MLVTVLKTYCKEKPELEPFGIMDSDKLCILMKIKDTTGTQYLLVSNESYDYHFWINHYDLSSIISFQNMLSLENIVRIIQFITFSEFKYNDHC